MWVRPPLPVPRRNGLRSIQKAQPFGWAFLIPLRHSYFSPQNFAVQIFVGAPPRGPRRGAGINFNTQTQYQAIRASILARKLGLDCLFFGAEKALLLAQTK